MLRFKLGAEVFMKKQLPFVHTRMCRIRESLPQGSSESERGEEPNGFLVVRKSRHLLNATVFQMEDMLVLVFMLVYITDVLCALCHAILYRAPRTVPCATRY